jgi:hypothetical protein
MPDSKHFQRVLQQHGGPDHGKALVGQDQHRIPVLGAELPVLAPVA